MADKHKNEDQQQQLDTTLNSAQILSVPSQQPEPPKHSTPKRPETEWFDRPPTFDISSICGDEFDQKFEINTISLSARKNLLGIERNKSTLNFGYVPIGGSMLLRQKIWNCDSEQMRIKCSILAALKDINLGSSCFKIMDISSPIMQPGEWCEITVKYEPEKSERNVARLAVERENGAHFRYSFILIGNGGNAQLSLDANFDAGIAFRATSNQAIIIRPDIFNRFWLTFENRGQRSAFVSLIATNSRGTILSREVGREQQKVFIQPAQFVLDACDEKGSANKHKINVLIRVNETFNWTIGVINARDSLLSSASESNSQSDCAFQILAYWGEENQRQRLKCWERAYKPFYKDGFRFTGCFENEQQLNLEQRGKLQENVKEDDALEFKNTLRIVRMNVVDDRARTYFPSQPDALQPLLNMFKNHRFLLNEVHPEEEIVGSNSTIMPFRNVLDL